MIKSNKDSAIENLTNNNIFSNYNLTFGNVISLVKQGKKLMKICMDTEDFNTGVVHIILKRTGIYHTDAILAQDVGTVFTHMYINGAKH